MSTLGRRQPVAGGNVETSQRIVDALLRALAPALPDRIPAASSGTMNNLTIGGIDPRSGPNSGQSYTYYETIAGGHGASPQSPGACGHHAHMTNSLNTPVEALEYAYPFRMIRYAIRCNSGGAGKHRGGDGIVRELELLGDAQVTLLADRRTTAPGASPAANPASRAARQSSTKKPQALTMESKSNSPANAPANSAPALASASNLPAAAVGAGNSLTCYSLLPTPYSPPLGPHTRNSPLQCIRLIR